MENEASAVAPSPKSSEGLIGWVESTVITVSQTSMGQTFLKLIDRFLWVVEKTAQWSLPCPEIVPEENGKLFGKMELVRPLPWILFLPGLVVLRAIRVGLNAGAFILGYPQIQPSSMVKFVQKSRRRLRALNLKAVKNLRRKAHSTKDKRLSMIEAKKALIRSIRLTLSTLSCLDNTKSSPSPPPTKIHISGMDLTTVTSEEKSTTESTGSPAHTDTKRKFSEISTDESEGETLQTKIERLAMEDSADDMDFNPADCSTESSSENEDDLEVSLTELQQVKEEAIFFLKENTAADLKIPESTEKLTDEFQKQTIQESSKTADSASLQVNDTVDFDLPLKLSQGSDMAYYSPISSKSGSPEPSMSCSTERELFHEDKEKTINFINGEITYNSDCTKSGTLKEEATNGVVSEKRNTGKQQHHKGKRNHENRKKK